MSEQIWSAVDNYLNELVVRPHKTLEAATRASTDAGLPAIAVSASQGKLLHILARLQNARKILEIGTLGGYSTIWLASALKEDGKLVSLDIDERHQKVAATNIAHAGLSALVELRLGSALDLLPHLHEEGAGPFDLIFIDADKERIPEYFLWSLKLARTGTLIIVDNVVRKGEVIDATSENTSVHGVRRFNELLATEKRVTATTIQTVGSKGYDGMTLAYVLSVEASDQA
ncbi:MAG TPA: O-methyltransferase [Planktothrix sp.]|jgi:predicted O-methyltransferase YrrM